MKIPKKLLKKLLKKTFSFPKIACESPKYALKGSKSTTHRGKKIIWRFLNRRLAFFGIFSS
jgi:hypothetical protein